MVLKKVPKYRDKMKSDKLSLFSDDVFDPQVLPDNILSDKVIRWLTELYDATDWRCVIMDRMLDHEYDGVPTTSYLKALALPYLVNIPQSERALSRIILARSNLQKLCGFRVGHQVKKDDLVISDEPAVGLRTFWHFRDKYKEIYSELIIKVLISLVLSGKYPNLGLPFVEKIEENQYNNEGKEIKWVVDAYRPAICISLPWTEKDLPTRKDKEGFEEWSALWKEKFRNSKDFNEFRDLKDKYDEEFKAFVRRTKKGFTEEVNFPIDISTSFASGAKLFFRLKNPVWFTNGASGSQISSFTNDVLKLSNLKAKYDKACNILVVNKKREILLSRRKLEGTGEGSFAAPGGKQREGETLEACAIRELEEETGLVLQKSRPVSLYFTLQESGKQIVSVGVLAELWDGVVKTMEPNKHVGWEWHNLNDLPAPIFEFTQIAITQFQESKYPNLTWEDVEEKPDIQLSFLDQIRGT